MLQAEHRDASPMRATPQPEVTPQDRQRMTDVVEALQSNTRDRAAQDEQRRKDEARAKRAERRQKRDEESNNLATLTIQREELRKSRRLKDKIEESRGRKKRLKDKGNTNMSKVYFSSLSKYLTWIRSQRKGRA